MGGRILAELPGWGASRASQFRAAATGWGAALFPAFLNMRRFHCKPTRKEVRLSHVGSPKDQTGEGEGGRGLCPHS